MFSSSAKALCHLALFAVPFAPQAIAQNCTTGPVIGPTLFTATIKIGGALSPNPIPGGVQEVEPITGGKVTGQALNATVDGGLAYPTVVENGSIEIPQIYLYGTTSENTSYFAQIDGIGSTKKQLARLTFEIGGRYSALTNEFILASINPNPDHTTVIVEGFEIKQCWKGRR